MHDNKLVKMHRTTFMKYFSALYKQLKNVKSKPFMNKNQQLKPRKKSYYNINI